MAAPAHRTLGIDLGASFVRAALCDPHGRTEPVALGQPGQAAPGMACCVAQDPAHASAQSMGPRWRVGDAASARAIMAAEHTAAALPRLLTLGHDEPTALYEAARRPEGLAQGPRGDAWVALGEAAVAPEEALAQLLRRARHAAEAQAGHAIDTAVLCVPHGFDAPQRRAVHQAAQMAGLRVARLLAAPVAAALAPAPLAATVRPISAVDGEGAEAAEAMQGHAEAVPVPGATLAPGEAEGGGGAEAGHAEADDGAAAAAPEATAPEDLAEARDGAAPAPEAGPDVAAQAEAEAAPDALDEPQAAPPASGDRAAAEPAAAAAEPAEPAEPETAMQRIAAKRRGRPAARRAAAAAASADAQSAPPPAPPSLPAQCLLVADWGGSTLEAAVIRLGHDSVEVLAQGSDLLLGGHDCDEALVSDICADFHRQHGIDLRADAIAHARVRLGVQRAREALSADEATQLELPHIAATEAGSLHIQRRLDRGVLAAATDEAMARAEALCRQVVHDAALPEGGLTGIWALGGMAQTPGWRAALDALAPGLDAGAPSPASPPSATEAAAAGAAHLGTLMRLDAPPIALVLPRDERGPLDPKRQARGLRQDEVDAIVARDAARAADAARVAALETLRARARAQVAQLLQARPESLQPGDAPDGTAEGDDDGAPGGQGMLLDEGLRPLAAALAELERALGNEDTSEEAHAQLSRCMATLDVATAAARRVDAQLAGS